MENAPNIIRNEGKLFLFLLLYLEDMVDEEIVIQVGSKTIAKATLSAMNNNIYN